MSESLDYDIVILTTAISRPNLHSKVFENVEYFLGDYKCKWIISIDKILDGSLDETENNFYKILDVDNIDLTVRKSEDGACRMSWYKSVKYCINEGYKYKPSFGYLWLEDDWCYNSKLFNLKDSIKSINNLTDTNFYISLVGRGAELNFNPSFWSVDLYKKYMYEKINSTKVPENGGNAERFVCYTGVSGNGSNESMEGINSFNLSLFSEVGRNWADKNISGKRTFN